MNMLFRQLRQEDLLLDMEDIDNFSEEELTKICFKRGINIRQSRSEQLKDLKLWLSISNKRNVPHILLLVTRIHDFNNDNFEVDADETEAEILRRVSNHNLKLLTKLLFAHLVQERRLLYRVSARLRESIRHGSPRAHHRGNPSQA